MAAGIGSVCDKESVEDMGRTISEIEGLDSLLSIKTYLEGTHSIHNSAQDEFMNDLEQIINSLQCSKL